VRGRGSRAGSEIEGLHLTLRFLGATPDVRLAELSAAVAAARVEWRRSVSS